MYSNESADKKPAAVPSSVVSSSATADGFIEDWIPTEEDAPKSLTYKDHDLTFRGIGVKGVSRYYCKYGRSCDGCDFAAKIQPSGAVLVSGSHTTQCAFKNGIADRPGTKFTMKDCKEIMKQETIKMARDPKHYTPEEVWSTVSTKAKAEFGDVYIGLKKRQVTDLVHNTRKKEHGGNAIRAVEERYGGTKNDAFLRHSCSFADKKKMQRMMCFAVPGLLSFLNEAGVS